MTARRPLALAGVVALAALGASCAPSPKRPGATAPSLDLASATALDLSHAYDSDTIYWPTSPSGFELEELHYGPTPGGWFYSAYRLATPEHGGTHLDAPMHFGEGRWSADEIPVERLIGPAVVLDIAVRAAAEPDTTLTVEDVADWEARHGAVPRGAIALLRTGWSERWPDRLRYLGDDTPGDASNLHFPAFGLAAARLLIEERGVTVLGLDTASLDAGQAHDFPVHQLAAAANVAGLENLDGLDRVPPTGAWIVALPMKIAGGSGGPARVVALLPEPPD